MIKRIVNPKKRKLSAIESKKWIPIISELNKMADAIVKILTNQVQEKEKKLHTLSLIVSDIKIPQKSFKTIEIRLTDINDTKVMKKGQWSFNQRMNWENDIRDKKKGQII